MASEFVQPYMELSRDMGLVLYNVGDTYRLLIIEKYPQFLEYVSILYTFL